MLNFNLLEYNKYVQKHLEYIPKTIQLFNHYLKKVNIYYQVLA